MGDHSKTAAEIFANDVSSAPLPGFIQELL
jgi:hypothetical protein